MKTKIIPFDLETAKKIQAGEIKGRIVTAEGERARIVCFDRNGFKYSILALITIDDSHEIDMFYTSDGKASKQSRFDIHIELPEETPKHEFKPFDKVLVRNGDNEAWNARLYDVWFAELGLHGADVLENGVAELLLGVGDAGLVGVEFVAVGLEQTI